MDYSYLQVDLLMLSEEIYENILLFLILPTDLLLTGTHRPQIVMKILMVLVLRVNLYIILPLPIVCSRLQAD